MSRQLHKRLSKEFVENILEAFNDHRIAEEKACELLGIKRAQLYKLRQRWLQCLIGKKPFALYSRRESAFHRLPDELERWLHEELHFIQKKAPQKLKGRWRRPSIICRDAFRISVNDTTSELSWRHGKY